MATLAQINETLRDQTSSIEDGTKTTAGLRDRFGEFLDRQQGSGDKREQEIEERQKERRRNIMASRPRSFSQGLTQGLGFGGLNFGGIAEKILGAMGLAAGAIGLGAGRLLRLGPAIAVVSKFGEQAIGGLIDYLDKEIDGIDFSEKAKNDLTKGAQFGLAARFLGFRNPLAVAIAGAVGAYGDEAIDIVNKRLKNDDGTYKVPFLNVEIDTKTEGFQMALAYAAATIAPTILGLTGTLLKGALKKIPLVKAASLVGAATMAFFGLKGSGTPPDPDEIKNNKKTTVKTVKPISAASAYNFRSAIQTTTNIPNVANLNTSPMSFSTAAQTKSSVVSTKYNDAIMRMAKASDGLKKVVSKTFLPAAIVYEYMSGLKDPALANTPNSAKGTVNLLAETTGGTIDLLANGVNAMINLASMGVNRGLNQIGTDAQIPMLPMNSDVSGFIKRSIDSGFAAFKSAPALNYGAQPPNVGLAPPELFNAFPNGQVQFNDLSNNQQNRGGDMNVISIGNTQDFGSKVVDIGKF